MKKPSVASSVTVTFIPAGGADFRICVQQAIILAITENCTVEFTHSERKIVIVADDLIKHVTLTQKEVNRES